MAVFFYWSGHRFDFGNYLAIASAALHTTGDVVVFVDEPPVDNPHYRRLAGLPNVGLEPLTPGTLLSTEHAKLYRRMEFAAHRSDLVSFSVLAKYGGIFLDTDTLTAKSLDHLPERLLCEDGKIVHLGVLGLPSGDPLAKQMLADLLNMPVADLSVYQSIVHRWTCIVRRVNVTFSELAHFFPVHWRDWEQIFTPGGYEGRLEEIAILHHYGYFSSEYTSRMDARWVMDNPCLFSHLARPILRRLEQAGAML